MSLNEAKRLYSQGRQKLAAGDLQGAIAKFKQALQFAPNYYPVLDQLAAIMRELNHYQEAISYYEKILQIEPNHIQTWFRRGFALQNLGRNQEAIASYDKVLQLNSEDFDLFETWVNRSLALLAIGHYQDALIGFETALEIEPHHSDIWSNRGAAFLGLERYKEAINSFDRAIKISSNHPLAWSNRGRALHGLKRYEEAIINYRQSIEGDPGNSTTWSNLGLTLKVLGHYEDTLSAYETSLKIKPNQPNVWFEKGFSLQKLGRYEEAILSYRRALKLQPIYCDAWNDLGVALADLKRYQEAIACYDKALEIQFDRRFYLNKGIALHNLKLYDEAIACYEKVIETSSDKVQAQAWSSRAAALSELTRYEEALVSCDHAIEIEPDNIIAWSNRALTLRDMKRYKEAVIVYDKLLNIKSNQSDIWCRRGLAFSDLGYYEEAIHSYDKALEIKPDDCSSWNNRGAAFHVLGNYEESLNSFTKAININPREIIYWNGCGDVLLKLNCYKDAQESYESSLAIEPNQPAIWTYLGITLEFQEFYSVAVRAYDRAIQVDDQCWIAWGRKGLLMLTTHGLETALSTLDEAFLTLRSDLPDYSQGCGFLHHAKGSIYYRAGKERENCLSSWRKSISFYKLALKSYEKLELPEFYLDYLRSLIKALLGVGQLGEADELLRQGNDYLKRLLDETPSPGKRRLIALEFAGFDQLTVDALVQAGQVQKEKFIEALETAEKGKNVCLSWLLYALSDALSSPGYEEIQQLLSPRTAIAYWHLSPAALTTFVLKPGEVAPIVITQPSTSDRPPSLQQLLNLEAWIQEWDDQYQDYRNQGKEHRNANHSWRKDMAQRLFERQEEPGNLKEILNIEAIEQHLEDIDHLILIPHRDLHRFPLHALFDSQFTVSYLPSIQVGLNLKGRQPSNMGYLLSIENPESDLGFARVESQVISQTFQQVNFIREVEATQETVMNALNEGCNVLHFSGHAGHNSENPQRSELSLARNDRLTLQEICQHDLTGYDLVCLSACETALTNNQSITTEYVGLVSGFLYSGVAQVISTLWLVESAASALVMIEFYRRRSDRSDAISLAEAIQWLRGLTRKSFETWCTARLAELPPNLPRERRSRIKLTLDQTRLQWNTIEEDVQNPYSWASFTLSGGFFS
ncbi:MAG: tetratricopeptide repeat protein [Synechococcales bacterium]|nr:tetratricopeptide repeat protein [Synechococcales bacterium]